MSKGGAVSAPKGEQKMAVELPATGDTTTLMLGDRTFENSVIVKGSLKVEGAFEAPGGGGAGITWSQPPVSFTSPGTPGDLAYNDEYLFVCTFPDTWKRVAIATW